jgi:riboflavin kinase / FMN adenylyltransferase
MKFAAPIISGHGRGRQLTFPTINLDVGDDFEVENGVYAVWVKLEEDRVQGAMHVGPRPTFHLKDRSVEIFLLDFYDEVTVEMVEVEVLGRIRGVMSFETSDALKKQIEQDIMAARALFSANTSND